MVKEFSPKTQEELAYYVYVLIDPRDNKIFYIGKGNSNRVFSHINEAIENPKETEKLETIRAIKNDNLKVKHFIIRHGLKENEAFLLEAALIDFLTYKDFADVAKITNLVSGHYSFNQGIKTVEDCEILYNCKELEKSDIKHSILIININKTFDKKRRTKNEDPIYDRPNIYEATRGWWVLDINRARNTDYVLAEYRGVIRAIFKPERWMQNKELGGAKRWGFEGSEVNDMEIIDLYINKVVPKTQGMANPIRYFAQL